MIFGYEKSGKIIGADKTVDSYSNDALVGVLIDNVSQKVKFYLDTKKVSSVVCNDIVL